MYIYDIPSVGPAVFFFVSTECYDNVWNSHLVPYILILDLDTYSDSGAMSKNGLYFESNAYNKQLIKKSLTISSFSYSSLLYNSSQDIWINLDDRKRRYNFRWGDGSGDLMWYHWSNWESGQPNNFWSEDYLEEQDCVELEPSYDLQWNDELCSFKNAYVCQKEKGGPLWIFFFRKLNSSERISFIL